MVSSVSALVLSVLVLSKDGKRSKKRGKVRKKAEKGEKSGGMDGRRGKAGGRLFTCKLIYRITSNMLTPEFREFYENWITKADQCREDRLGGSFDRFFTLFVIYNRLYAEATFHLARLKEIDFVGRSAFPDGKAAREYVSQFLGAENLMRSLNEDDACKDAMTQIEAINAMLLEIDVLF